MQLVSRLCHMHKKVEGVSCINQVLSAFSCRVDGLPSHCPGFHSQSENLEVLSEFAQDTDMEVPHKAGYCTIDNDSEMN